MVVLVVDLLIWSGLKYITKKEKEDYFYPAKNTHQVSFNVFYEFRTSFTV